MKRPHAEAHRHQIHPHHRRGAHRHRAGLRVRLFRHPGLQGPEGRGLPHRPRQLQSGHYHDRPGAGGRDLHRAHHARDRRQDHRAGASRCPAPHHGRADRAEYGARPRQAGRARQVRRRDDRRQGAGHRHGRRPSAVPRGDDGIGLATPTIGARAQPRRGAGRPGARGPAGHHPALVHARRHRRRRRLQPGGVRRDRRAAASTPRRRTRC